MNIFNNIYYIILIIFIIILFLLVYSIQLNSNIKQYIINNWSYFKCQPYIVPIAGLFRKSNETMGFWEFTSNNFKKCSWVKIKVFFKYLIEPIQYILKIITTIIKNFRETLNVFRAEAKNIRNMFKKIVESIANKLTNSYAAIQFYQSKMQNILKQQIAIFSLLMYFIDSIKLTMESLINGPVIDLVKFMPVYAIALLALIIICTLCMVGGPFVKMVACPICLICFDGNTKCLLKDQTSKYIKDISIGDKILDGDIVTSYFCFDLLHKKCDMFRYKNINISGSHIVYEKDNIDRIENLSLAKKIDYKERFIYCLNTKNRYIIVENNKGERIKCSDFFENKNTNDNLYSQYIIQNTLNNLPIISKNNFRYIKEQRNGNNYDYEWSFDLNTLILLNNGSYKKIIDITFEDTLFNNNKIYGIVKHSSQYQKMYKYKNNIISGSQLIYRNNKWFRIYQLKDIIEIPKYKPKITYHLVTDSHTFYINNKLLVRDYLEIQEGSKVFDIILKQNLNSVKDREKKQKKE